MAEATIKDKALNSNLNITQKIIKQNKNTYIPKEFFLRQQRLSLMKKLSFANNIISYLKDAKNSAKIS
jgi:hypothetical protein